MKARGTGGQNAKRNSNRHCRQPRRVIAAPDQAAELAPKEAHEAMEEAIKTSPSARCWTLKKRLPETQALFAAAMALHRGNN